MKQSQSSSLDTLKPGQTATISSLIADENSLRRFIAMGFGIGKRIKIIRKGLGRGPLQVRLGTVDIIMRRHDASHIIVQR